MIVGSFREDARRWVDRHIGNPGQWPKKVESLTAEFERFYSSGWNAAVNSAETGVVGLEVQLQDLKKRLRRRTDPLETDRNPSGQSPASGPTSPPAGAAPAARTEAEMFADLASSSAGLAAGGRAMPQHLPGLQEALRQGAAQPPPPEFHYQPAVRAPAVGLDMLLHRLEAQFGPGNFQLTLRVTSEKDLAAVVDTLLPRNISRVAGSSLVASVEGLCWVAVLE